MTHDRPNVLLIVLDTTRADYFSCYGHERPTTPCVDQIAEEGIRFGRAYATDFWTLPSHASLLTGLYPTEAQATSETNHLPDNVTTLAERLRACDYRTGAVVCNVWVGRERGFGRGFQDFTEMWRQPKPHTHAGRPALTEQTAVDQALAWMDAQAPGQAPFFLFVNFNVAHMPYRPPQAFWERFATRQWPAVRLNRLTRIAGMWPHLAGRLRLDETAYQIMRELYAAEVAVADAQVGQLVEALTKRSLLDDTLVIVTSDHGENIGDHGMIDHLLSMYETTLHIPLVIRYPKHFQAGAVSNELVSLVDIAPTILDVCGLPAEVFPAEVQRISLCQEDRGPREFVVAENDRPMNGVNLLKSKFPDFDTTTIDHRMRMIRTEHHKLIWRENGQTEVFDLESDPDEAMNIAETRPEIRDGLLGRLKEWMAAVEREDSAKAFESDDTEVVRRLRLLGYIE